MSIALSTPKQERYSARDKQPTDILVSSFADAAYYILGAPRFLARHKPEPSDKLAAEAGAHLQATLSC